TRFSRDWSSDVCSSDLRRQLFAHHLEVDTDFAVKNDQRFLVDRQLVANRYAEITAAIDLSLLDILFGEALNGCLQFLIQRCKPRSEERRVGKESGSQGS